MIRCLQLGIKLLFVLGDQVALYLALHIKSEVTASGQGSERCLHTETLSHFAPAWVLVAIKQCAKLERCPCYECLVLVQERIDQTIELCVMSTHSLLILKQGCSGQQSCTLVIPWESQAIVFGSGTSLELGDSFQLFALGKQVLVHRCCFLGA